MLDIRWFKEDGTRCTWKETLQAMSDYYGTFCGRWHTNDFWQAIAKQLLQMTEEDAEEKVKEVEEDADASLEYWRRMQ